MDTFGGREGIFILALEKILLEMHENEIILCPQPIFFDARDLVYQIKEALKKKYPKTFCIRGSLDHLESGSFCGNRSYNY